MYKIQANMNNPNFPIAISRLYTIFVRIHKTDKTIAPASSRRYLDSEG